jgi:hypothetical protein
VRIIVKIIAMNRMMNAGSRIYAIHLHTVTTDVLSKEDQPGLLDLKGVLAKEGQLGLSAVPVKKAQLGLKGVLVKKGLLGLLDHKVFLV